MRLDRFLSEMKTGTRSQVKNLLRQGSVTVNGCVAKDPGQRIDERKDRVCCRGKELFYREYVYYMLHKPAGVVSAVRDGREKTVISLLSGEAAGRALFPVGRLDKDTTGLLILTDDGALAHRLLSPKRHVDKIYAVTLENPLSAEDAEKLRDGVDIGDEKPTLPAGVEILSEREILLTIHEGRFHQVKRMIHGVGNEVSVLRRVGFGGLALDESLQPGEYRELTGREVEVLYEA